MTLYEFIATDECISMISIVDNPAIQVDFIKLRKEFQFKEVEKRILLGAALIPDKPIFRRDNNGKPYYGYFSKETVKHISEQYMSKYRQGEWNMNHDKGVEGITLVESWITEKPDKSEKYGFDVPEGTWMISAKVHNDEFWNEFIATGQLRGFSIEGHFAMKSTENQDIEEVIEKELNDWLSAYIQKHVENK
jgi:hypothetical protein